MAGGIGRERRDRRVWESCRGNTRAGRGREEGKVGGKWGREG